MKVIYEESKEHHKKAVEEYKRNLSRAYIIGIILGFFIFGIDLFAGLRVDHPELFFSVGGIILCIFAIGIILHLNLREAVEKSPSLKIYTDSIVVEKFSFYYWPYPLYKNIHFSDVVEIRKSELTWVGSLFGAYLYTRPLIVITPNKKYLIEKYFLENITFDDIIKIIEDWREEHNLPSLKYEHEQKQKSIEYQSNEICSSCKYEFTHNAALESKQKTIEISCPQCHRTYKKRITKKRQKK